MLRAADLTLVVLLLPLVLPVAAAVAAAVALDSPGPLIYRSRRVGYGGRPFDMFKFRTMVRDAQGPAISAAGDARYTPVGLFLARTRLDELPQLVNIVRGEMRFVGPRPELEAFVAAHPRDYEVILRVHPGLTGPAQLAYVSEGTVLAAADDQDRERMYREVILPTKVLIDRKYAQHRTARGDLLLIVRTLSLPLAFLSAAARSALVGVHPAPASRAQIAATIVLLIGFVGVFASDGLA